MDLLVDCDLAILHFSMVLLMYQDPDHDIFACERKRVGCDMHGGCAFPYSEDDCF